MTDTCKRCGGGFTRDVYGDVACLMCGRPRETVVPLPKLTREWTPKYYGRKADVDNLVAVGSTYHVSGVLGHRLSDERLQW